MPLVHVEHVPRRCSIQSEHRDVEHRGRDEYVEHVLERCGFQSEHRDVEHSSRESHFGRLVDIGHTRHHQRRRRVGDLTDRWICGEDGHYAKSVFTNKFGLYWMDARDTNDCFSNGASGYRVGNG